MNKSNDPGLWDTLMGGMVSSADTIDTALSRETWEEAGLKLSQLQDLSRGGVLSIRKPAIDGNGAGYVVEEIDWYACIIPDGVVPANQDGEVAQFRLMQTDEVVAAMQRGEFTAEAALILVEVMGFLLPKAYSSTSADCRKRFGASAPAESRIG